MSDSSTRQLDAIWILHDASSKRCYLEAIFSNFEASIGPEMRGMATILIAQCDMVMEGGDHIQYPKDVPFKVPEHYQFYDDEDIQKELFWNRIMQPCQPFMYA